MRKPLPYALAAARRGWHVFPLHPGDKAPARAFTEWETNATLDPGRITAYFTRDRYNVGIACGPSGLVVIDLDMPKPGEVPPAEWAQPGINDGTDVFAALCEQHGQPFPWETFAVRTRRGGLHLYFTAPVGSHLRNTKGGTPRGLGWLIDTRAHGGYVVGPGSHVVLPDGTGTYEVLDPAATPEPLPEWLLSLLSPAQAPPSPIGGKTPTPDAIKNLSAYAQAALNGGARRVAAATPGSRNYTLNNNAYQLGQLVGAGILPEDLVTSVLYEAASAHFGPDPEGIPPRAALATIRAGIDAGTRNPRKVA